MSSPSASLPGNSVIDLEIDSEVEDVIVVEDSSEGSSSKEDGMDVAEAEAEENRLISQKYEIVDYEDLAEQHKNTGNEEYKMKRYDSAIRSYTEAINLCNEIPAYYGNRAACYIMVGNYKAALRDAKQAVTIDDKFEKGYMRMAKCSLILGDAIAAEQAIKKYLALDASGALVKHEIMSLKVLRELNEKAAASYDRHDYRTCVFLCDSAIKIASDSIHHKLMRAECLAMLDRFQEAEDIAIDIMKLYPTNVDAIYVRGLALYYSDNLDKGLQHFERTLQLDPDHKKAKSLLKKAKQLKEKKETGNELFKIGKYREALAIYTEALQLDPLNKDINSKLYYNRSLVNSKLGNVRDAIADCTGALKNFDKYTKALLQRAKLHHNMENYEECVNDYEAALKLERTTEIRNMLKEAKFQLKKSKRKDYYKILGVTKQASDDEIKKAYRKRALVHHPDRHANSSEMEKKEQEKKFKELGEAYTVLSDPVKKSRYDSGQDIEGLGQSSTFDDQQMFQQFFFPSDGGYSRFNGGTSNFTFQFT